MDNQQNSFYRYYNAARKTWDIPQVKTFSTAAATLFLIAFFSLAALKPTIETISTLHRKIADARQTEEAMTKKIADLNTAFSQYSLIAQDIPLIWNYLPDHPANKNAVDILTANATNSGLRKNYSYSLSEHPLDIGQTTAENTPRIMGKSPVAINVSFNAEQADSQALLNFLDNLLSAQRLFAANSISYYEDEKKQSGFQMNLNTYYYGIDKSKGSK